MSFKGGYQLFYTSLGLGIFLWLFIFMLTPVEVMEHLKVKTIFFVSLCYIFMLLGFGIVPIKKRTLKEGIVLKRKLYVFNLLAGIIVLSFILRWIDLFVFREVSFGLDPKSNRGINIRSFSKSYIFFIIPSILKSLYFFPFVLWIFDSFHNLRRKHLIISIIILGLPIVEAIVFGTRKPFMDILLIVVISLFTGGYLNFSLKKVVAFSGASLVVLIISMSILFQRESVGTENKEEFYDRILSADYNLLLEPKESIVSFIKDSSRCQVSRMSALILLQTGQYFVHGLFEFNHIIDSDLSATKGAYTFYPIAKLIQKIEGKDIFEHSNPSPKKIVYLTTFGGFYIDFKWFSLIVFFVFGIIQKIAFREAKRDFFYLPIVIYFLIINVFLLSFNYLSGQGIYPFIAFGIVLGVLLMTQEKINGKSINT